MFFRFLAVAILTLVYGKDFLDAVTNTEPTSPAVSLANPLPSLRWLNLLGSCILTLDLQTRYNTINTAAAPSLEFQPISSRDLCRYY